MTSTARLTNRNGDLTWPARIGLTGLILEISYRVGRDPQLVNLLFGAAIAGLLVAVPAEVFLGLMLLLRDLSDAVADSPLAAGLNAGGVLGILAIGAGSLRLLGRRDLHALGAVLPLMGLLLVWTVVGYVTYGFDTTVTREMVRGTSILVITLVATASVRRLADIDRLVAIIVGVSALEAALAVMRWLTGGDLAARERATFAHPNTAAAVFGVALALSFWKLIERRSIIYIVAAVVLGAGLLSTGSVGGLVQMLATLLAYAVLARGKGRSLAVKGLVFGVVVVGVFSLTSIGQHRVTQLQNTQSYSSFQTKADEQNSLAWRLHHWSLELKAWRVHPFFGYGEGATTSHVQPEATIPHSDYLRYLVETGVVGSLVFGIAFLLILRSVYQRTRAPAETVSFACALLAIIIGLAVRATEENISLQTTVMYMVGVLIGGLFGVKKTVIRQTAEPVPVGTRAT